MKEGGVRSPRPDAEGTEEHAMLIKVPPRGKTCIRKMG